MNITEILEIKLPHLNPTIEEVYQHKGFLFVLKNNTIKTFELDSYRFETYDSKEDFDKQTNALECYYQITSKETGKRIIEAFPDIIEVWMCDI